MPTPRSPVRPLAAALAALAALLAVALPPRPARAFCGFYVAGSDARLLNRATMVVLLRDGTRTVLSMQNHYEGPPADFAMVVPVPVVLGPDNVKTLRDDVFDRVDRLASPRLVEYWEQDPCATGSGEGTIGLGSIGAMGSGQGYGSGAGRGLGVRVEAQFEVGEYQIVILSARDSSGLDTWLRAEGYHIPAGAERVLEPYVRAGSKFFVARVNVARVHFENGRARLSPLRFHYDSERFELPIRLGLLNSPGTQDLVVHVLARDQRFDVANRPNVTIPTNLDVTDAVRARFGDFYAALFDQTLARNPGAVVTEYAWPSTSCDPCPGPALDPSDVFTLGGDVAPSVGPDAAGLSSRGASGPLVRAAPPVVTGLLSPEAIRRVVLRNLGQVAHCHEQGLARNPNQSGRVVVRFTIGGNGAVTGSNAAESSLGMPSVEQCIANAVRRWQFPSPEGGGVVTVNYPFLLASPSGAWVGGGGGGGSGGRRPGGNGGLQGWVLTRLHMRYGAEGLGDDLVFRTAGPIVGGRELPGATGALEHGAQPSGSNNFQARYAIRHPWTGPVTCANPRRGIWGPPPAGSAAAGTGAEPNTLTATDTAFAARDAVRLASVLTQPVPEIGIDSVTSASANPAPPARGDGGAPAAMDGGIARPPGAAARGAAPRRSARGCGGGCAIGLESRASHSRATARGLLAALAAGALGFARRRRARRD